MGAARSWTLPDLAFTTLLAVGLGTLAWWLIRTRLGTAALKGVPVRHTNARFEHVLIAFAVYLLTMAALAGVRHFFAPDPSKGAIDATAVIIDSISKLLACLVVLLLLHRQGKRLRRLSPLASRLSVLRRIGFGLMTFVGVWPGCFAMVIASEWALSQLVPSFTPPPHVLLEMYRGTLSSEVRLLLIIVAIGVAPLVEEFFFRGLLQSALLNLTKSRAGAIVLTALLFALVHLPQIQVLLPLFVFSLALGYAYERSGSLTAPIIAHVAFNTVPFIFA